MKKQTIPTDGPDLPATVVHRGREYYLTITKRKLDDWWIVKYERLDGSGRIWEYTESPSLVMAEVAMQTKLKSILKNPRL